MLSGGKRHQHPWTHGHVTMTGLHGSCRRSRHQRLGRNGPQTADLAERKKNAIVSAHEILRLVDIDARIVQHGFAVAFIHHIEGDGPFGIAGNLVVGAGRNADSECRKQQRQKELFHFKIVLCEV